MRAKWRAWAAILTGCAVAAVALAPAASADYVPEDLTLYHDGPSGRYLLGGEWLQRRDLGDVGLKQRFYASASTDGWAPVAVPNAWNAGDDSMASYVGGPVWYRKDFRLPDEHANLAWLVRFESVNYRATVWLNGAEIGKHEGAYIPFEVLLSKKLRRTGVNRLVVRVDNRRGPSDFPPESMSFASAPRGGWWNYGGILREVYLRRVDRVDMRNVQVLPRVGCLHCTVPIDFRLNLKSYAGKAERVRLVGNYGSGPVHFRTVTLRPGDAKTVTARVLLPSPHLWSPSDPHLYLATLAAATAPAKGGGFSDAESYSLFSGVRSIRVVKDRLMLNGKPVHFRGVGVHEDDPARGAAIGNADRERAIADAKQLGAGLIRSHYPLHPYTYELADKEGLLVWSEVPVYRVSTNWLVDARVRRRAVGLVGRNILVNGNHPSIAIWSVANELTAAPHKDAEVAYMNSAIRTARRLDPTRLVGYALAGHLSDPCPSIYRSFDVLGVNDYFGWYASVADPAGLSPYLDKMHACYPRQALTVSEFGAEANRHGPATEKGTYEFQRNFVRYHLGVFAKKPYLGGAVYWTLQEFKVRPGWNGGNPQPTPPWHRKGLIDQDGVRKPAFFDVQELYRATDQFGNGPFSP